MSHGIICLDIDGTLTHEIHQLDPKVVDHLKRLHDDGWLFAFITGRTFAWGYRTLASLPFPYYLAVMNGAIIVELPSKKILSTNYLSQDILVAMDEICSNEPTDYVIYGGMEHDDLCYYRSAHFEPDLKKYLKARSTELEETWIDVPTFEQLHIKEFPSIKCFGKWDSTSRIVEKIEHKLGLHVPLIRDPFNSEYYVAQATHPLVSKGHALSELKELLGIVGPVIAAGDDHNDRSMLRLADIKIAMANSPQELLEIADVIAPPATQQGIIKGLNEAIHLLSSRKLMHVKGIIGFEHYEIPCVIGVYPKERRVPQSIFVDLKVELDMSECVRSDKLQDTLDYVKLAAVCSDLAQNGNYQLIETYAYDVVQAFLQYPQVSWVWIKIKKPQGLASAMFTTIELEQYQGK